MVAITIQKAQQFAANAGFTGIANDIIVAIARAESGFNADKSLMDSNAFNSNDPNGGSFGVLQINGFWINKGLTTKSCALDPQCAFNFAFTNISHGGTFFGDWSTYSGGAYKQFMPSGNANGGVPPPPPGSSSSSTTLQSNTCAWYDIPCQLSNVVQSDIMQRVSIVGIGITLALIGIVVLFIGHGGSVVT